MNELDRLWNIVFLGQVLRYVHEIAQALQDDPCYSKQDVVDELLRMADAVKQEIVERHTGGQIEGGVKDVV